MVADIEICKMNHRDRWYVCRGVGPCNTFIKVWNQYQYLSQEWIWSSAYLSGDGGERYLYDSKDDAEAAVATWLLMENG